MADQDIPFGAERYNYAAGERPAARVPLPAATPVPVTTPTPTPSFRDTSLTFEQRMARNQLPGAAPSSTPFLERAQSLQDRAQEGIKNLIGNTSAPTPITSPTPNPNILADRTGALKQIVNAIPAPTISPISSPSPLTPIKPGAQSNSFIGPKLNTTPAVIPTADKLPSLIDARFANKTGTEYPQ